MFDSHKKVKLHFRKFILEKATRDIKLFKSYFILPEAGCYITFEVNLNLFWFFFSLYFPGNYNAKWLQDPLRDGQNSSNLLKCTVFTECDDNVY